MGHSLCLIWANRYFSLPFPFDGLLYMFRPSETQFLSPYHLTEAVFFDRPNDTAASRNIKPYLTLTK